VTTSAPASWLVLCSVADPSALWVYERLRVRMRAAVSLLLVESLAAPAVRWEHRVDDAGATLALDTVDGTRIESAGIGAVLNRLVAAPLALVELAEPEDREYARSELTAFAASWLCVLSATVVNRPSPQGLAGRWRPPLEWRVLAALAGVATAPLRMRSDDGSGTQVVDLDEPSTWVLAVDGRVLHDGVPLALQRAVARLSARVDARVLGLRFCGPDPAAAGWRLLDATPYPDLSLAGEIGVAAIERALST
jgi:hypothetical protein